MVIIKYNILIIKLIAYFYRTNLTLSNITFSVLRAVRLPPALPLDTIDSNMLEKPGKTCWGSGKSKVNWYLVFEKSLLLI